MTTPSATALHCLKTALRDELESRHGPLIGGPTLVSALGLASPAALRQARKRGHVAVAVFTLPKRRGVFALTRDVAEWLADVRSGSSPPVPPAPPTSKKGASPDRP